MKSSNKEILVHIALLATMVAAHVVTTNVDKSTQERNLTATRPTAGAPQKFNLFDVLKR